MARGRFSIGIVHKPDNAIQSGIPSKWSAPAGVASRPGLSVKFGKRTCKPNSVVCGHSSRRRVAADTHQRPTRRFRRLHRAARECAALCKEPPERIGPMRSAAWLLTGASLPIWSCSVWGLPCPRRYRRSGALLPHHFTLTPALRQQAASGSPYDVAVQG